MATWWIVGIGIVLHSTENFESGLIIGRFLLLRIADENRQLSLENSNGATFLTLIFSYCQLRLSHFLFSSERQVFPPCMSSVKFGGVYKRMTVIIG